MDLGAPCYLLMPRMEAAGRCLVSGHPSAGDAVKTTAEMFFWINKCHGARQPGNTKRKWNNNNSKQTKLFNRVHKLRVHSGAENIQVINFFTVNVTF